MSVSKRYDEASNSKPMSDKRVWWSRWPLVVLWGIGALLAVAPAMVGWSVNAFYTFDNQAGIDMSVESGLTPVWVQVLSAIAVVGALVLVVCIVRWARKQWLGWFLVGWILAAVVLMIGLAMFNIL